MNTPATEPSDAAVAQAFNEYLDINTGGKSAGTVMTEIWERAKELTAEKVVTGIADVELLRALCEDVPDMHHSVRSQLQALASKIESGAKIGVTRCRRCGDKAEVTIHEASAPAAAVGGAMRYKTPEELANGDARVPPPAGGFVVDEDAMFKLFYDTHVAEFERLEPITRPDYPRRMQDNTDAATKAGLRAVYAALAASPTAQPSAKDGVRVCDEEREVLGQLVRLEWMDWAREQPVCKPSWFVPWEELSEPDREVDRRIGERIAYTVRKQATTASGLVEWRWVDEKGRAMTNWKQGEPPPMSAVSDSKGTMRVETRKAAIGREVGE